MNNVAGKVIDDDKQPIKIVETTYKMLVDCDLSLVTLKNALREFIKRFAYVPTFLDVVVSVKDIFTVTKIISSNFDEYIAQDLGIKRLVFTVDQRFDDHYWQVIDATAGPDIINTIYSPGA